MAAYFTNHTICSECMQKCDSPEIPQTIRERTSADSMKKASQFLFSPHDCKPNEKEINNRFKKEEKGLYENISKLTNILILKQSAYENDPSAQYFLGKHYVKRSGKIPNYKKAFHFLSLSAEQGNIKAQYFLGTMYHKGQGVEKNLSLAEKYYRQAAEQGCMNAQKNLGFLYTTDMFGVKCDYAIAEKWLQLAAEQGDEESAYALQVILSCKNSSP